MVISGPRRTSKGDFMLRITANDNPRVLTFRLVGRLEGPWVHELEQSCRSPLENGSELTIFVDPTGVTYVDAAGKARFVEMHQRGVQFIAGYCLT